MTEVIGRALAVPTATHIEKTARIAVPDTIARCPTQRNLFGAVPTSTVGFVFTGGVIGTSMDALSGATARARRVVPAEVGNSLAAESSTQRLAGR
jgi:hypothetical protein